MSQGKKQLELPLFLTHDDVGALALVPDPVWIFNLDHHAFWWANPAAVELWGLDNLDQLINKDLSSDTEGARKRTEQTFNQALRFGYTEEPWTIYPNGDPVQTVMHHKAALVGEERHKAVVAIIKPIESTLSSDRALFNEIYKYLPFAITLFDMEGNVLYENPAATDLYLKVQNVDLLSEISSFESRFGLLHEGKSRLADLQNNRDGSQKHIMNTKKGSRYHDVDIRACRHPVSGDYIAVVTEFDVTETHEALEESKQLRAEFKHLAHYDALTGLPTRRLVLDRLQVAIANARRNKKKIALMFVDLDDFKQVNDAYGHGAGDEFLKEVGVRLKKTLRDSDTVGRIGGDEFVIILPGMDALDYVSTVANNILDSFAMSCVVSDENGKKVEVSISASIGIAFYPDDGGTPEQLLQQADRLMYGVKSQGKNSFSLRS